MSHNMTLSVKGVEIKEGFAVESEIKLEHKFNPKADSVIIALNTGSREDDLELISDFYEGEPVALIGYWNGTEEMSYQLFTGELLDYASMIETLKFADQEAFLIITNELLGSAAYLYHFKHVARDCYPTYLGTMTQIESKQPSCTYCTATKTLWKAL